MVSLSISVSQLQAFIPNAGHGIQGATSHCLGQNFAKMFDIKFENEMQEKAMAMVWQNSWDYTTRTVSSLYSTFWVYNWLHYYHQTPVMNYNLLLPAYHYVIL